MFLKGVWEFTRSRKLAVALIAGALLIFALAYALVPLVVIEPSPPRVSHEGTPAERAAHIQANAALAAARMQQIANIRTGLLAAIGGFAALAGLVVNSRLQTRTLSQQTEALRVERERHITDRYSKAVEQLGEPEDGKVAIRLGGIFALQQLAAESEEHYHVTVVQVLSAFVRERTRQQSPGILASVAGGLRMASSVRPHGVGLNERLPADVQAAVTVLALLPWDQDMPRADLSNLHLEGLRLTKEIGEGQSIYDMVGRIRTVLEPWAVGGLDLRGAFLDGADFRSADLHKGVLMQGAHLANAKLQEVNLKQMQLQGVNLRGADLTRAELQATNLRGADLSHAIVEQDQINAAQGDGKTLLPGSLKRPSKWEN